MNPPPPPEPSCTLQTICCSQQANVYTSHTTQFLLHPLIQTNVLGSHTKSNTSPFCFAHYSSTGFGFYSTPAILEPRWCPCHPIQSKF